MTIRDEYASWLAEIEAGRRGASIPFLFPGPGGVIVPIHLTADEALIAAKSLASHAHFIKTGVQPSEVGFVYWRNDTPDPNRHGELLISVPGDDEYEACVVTDQVGEYQGPRGWFVAFENHDVTDLNAWAEFPEPSTLPKIKAEEEAE